MATDHGIELGAISLMKTFAETRPMKQQRAAIEYRMPPGSPTGVSHQMLKPLNAAGRIGC
jgi:hypothetical protein